ncbi:MAG: MOSC domain-containing protein, partial [Steroidobacteraceae bacterium]
LRLRVSSGRELTVPIGMRGKEVEVTCWRDQCAAFDAGDDAAALLSDHLESPVRLVRFDVRRKRASNRDWTKEIEALTQFADAFAWLAISQVSLDDLNARLPEPLPMNRFRPNIVIEGLPAFGEDRVHELVGDGVRLRAVKACTRCIVTTTNQATGRRDGDEPLRTLRQFRFDRELKGVTFGQNLILIEGAGRELRVGQELAAVEKATAR